MNILMSALMYMTECIDVYDWVHWCIWLSALMYMTECIDVYDWVHWCIWMSALMYMTECIDVYDWVHWCIWMSALMYMTECIDVYDWVHWCILMSVLMYMTECIDVYDWVHWCILMSALMYMTECIDVYDWVHWCIWLSALMYMTECIDVLCYTAFVHGTLWSLDWLFRAVQSRRAADVGTHPPGHPVVSSSASAHDDGSSANLSEAYGPASTDGPSQATRATASLPRLTGETRDGTTYSWFLSPACHCFQCWFTGRLVMLLPMLVCSV